MGNILSVLVDYVHYLWPIRIILPFAQGVRITLGKRTELLRPGWYFHVPFFQLIEDRSIQFQMIDCPIQTMETTDGFVVSVGANIAYEVFDFKLMVLNVYDFDHALERLARVHLFHVITNVEHARLRGDTREFERMARRTLQQQVKGWGVRIVRFGFTDLARAKTIRLLGDVPVKL